MGKRNQKSSGAAFKAGAVALAFLVTGYQTALFVHKAAVLRVQSVMDTPDTVYVQLPAAPPDSRDTADAGMASGGSTARSGPGGGTSPVRREHAHPEAVAEVRRAYRRVENFKFDPNTIDLGGLERLGFSQKQAQAIDNYRKSGGRFRRKSDFAKSFVVADSVYERLEAYIDIPKIDINAADSSAFDSLPGIGGWFASKIVSYRSELGGFSYPEQLMDIRNFDREKYDGLADLICCSPPRDSFALWSLPADALRRHPYIRSWQTARSIELFRSSMPRDRWTVKELSAAGILDPVTADKLSRCAIRRPAQ